ncbi:DEAD/DEAH box helicase [Amycolatopsis regifaucium]|uniref:RNA helicase n=1 Tax=Amycolatopsis regifaucium TaxID=546365 RepID=A0A154M6F2_9PSEU|nr:DEAD/DEAH box helicase [Amycolatopsis regifaucium]KZB80126.1 RNA helicase [Amycolatopsis regifaucium]OKA09504.1 RNA helicase [Amycolatopsis regifaucium]SFH63552.1 Superfamily II DNA and RNA helicase [Amycolatopsis regifaucium]
MSTPTFTELGLPKTLVDSLAEQGVTSPFPIQAATLPHSLAGRDVLGRGRTGSGKTYGFVLPVLARLAAGPTRRRPGRPRALVLAPTRELATQIEASFVPLAKPLGLKVTTIFGGVSPNPQITRLRDGVDIVVACPGRLADHMRSGEVKLDNIEITVLDEADHMADLGFLPDVRRIMAETPERGQRLLFSATLDAGVDVLVKRFMHDPVTHSVDSAQSPVSTMKHHVLHLEEVHRLPVLIDLTAAPGRTLVFTRTKHRAKQLTRKLMASGVPAVELHGNLGQTARTRNLEAFSSGAAKTLVATDIAARGIHVDDVTLVIHADPPVEHKAYLHRSGRTARAGASGTVVTLMTDAQVGDVRDLTRKAGIKPTTTQLGPGHPLLAELAPGERSFTASPRRPIVDTRPKKVSASGEAILGKGDDEEDRPPSRGRGNRAGRGRGPSAGGRGASGGGRRSGGSSEGRSRQPRAEGDRRGGAPAGQGRRGAETTGRREGAPKGGQARRGAAESQPRRGSGAAKSQSRTGSGGAPARRGGAAAFSSGTRAGARRSR